jgi:hypothetical protein
MFRFSTISLTILLLSLTVTACGQVPLAPTTLPSKTSTPILTATAAASPTSTATEALTPFPELRSKPYLMISPNRESQTFSFYDTSGGRKTIELPEDGYINSLNTKLDTIVSPDGQWLIFYTGHLLGSDGKPELPLTLKLLNIHDGTTITVSDIVTDGYKEKLDQLAGELKKRDPKSYEPQDDIDWVGGGIFTAFDSGIHSVAWSPDSRTLAFAAQIDGLSSDVYLYDLETGNVQQAEDSLQSVTGIRWSPDGEKIIFENSEPGIIYMGSAELYAINHQKETVKNPQLLAFQSWIGSFDPFTQTWSPTGDWLAPDILLVTYQTPDAGSSGIGALNINTKEITPLWDDIFASYAVDQEDRIIAIDPSEYTSPENLGVYIVNSRGKKQKIFNGLYYIDLFFRGGENHRFVLSGISSSEIEGNGTSDQYPIAGQVIGLDLEGKPTSIGGFEHQPQISISPDYNWLLIYDANKLNLYNSNDELVKSFPIPGIQRIIWMPDSQVVYYSNGSQLYMLSLPIGEPKLIDEINIQDSVWLP